MGDNGLELSIVVTGQSSAAGVVRETEQSIASLERGVTRLRESTALVPTAYEAAMARLDGAAQATSGKIVSSIDLAMTRSQQLVAAAATRMEADLSRLGRQDAAAALGRRHGLAPSPDVAVGDSGTLVREAANTTHAARLLARFGGEGAAALERVGGASRRAGEELALTNRRAGALASEGLGQVAQVSPQLVNLLGDMAAKSTLLTRGLQAAGIAGLGIAVAVTVWELVEKRMLAAVEAMKKVQEQERAYLTARGALQSFRIAQDSRALEIEGQTRAAQLRNAGRVIEAIEEERATKLKLLDVEERRARAELARLARTPEGAVKADRERAAVDARFGKERGAINAEADAQDIAERNRLQNEFDRARLDAERALAEAIHARRQAEAAASIEALQAEGRVVEALVVSTQQRLSTIRFEAEQRRAAIAERIKDEQLAEQARVELHRETSTRILQTLQQEQAQRRQIIAAGGTALQGQGIDSSLGALSTVDNFRKSRTAAAQGFAAAAANGAAPRDLITEQIRVQGELLARAQALRQELVAFPEAVEELDKEIANLQWGGFVNQVATVTTSLSQLGTDVHGTGDAFDTMGRKASGTVQVFRDQLPNSIGHTIAWVDALTGRLAVLEQWFDRAGRAADRFADE